MTPDHDILMDKEALLKQLHQIKVKVNTEFRSQLPLMHNNKAYWFVIFHKDGRICLSVTSAEKCPIVKDFVLVEELTAEELQNVVLTVLVQGHSRSSA